MRKLALALVLFGGVAGLALAIYLLYAMITLGML